LNIPHGEFGRQAHGMNAKHVQFLDFTHRNFLLSPVGFALVLVGSIGWGNHGAQWFELGSISFNQVLFRPQLVPNHPDTELFR
jgi:hypothetical protein